MTTTGVVLGKFLPPHRGHQYLLDFAQAHADQLTVMVCSLAREPIPGELRHRWVSEMAPRARVLHVTDENPQYPNEHERFWDIWIDTVRRRLPTGPDYFFASEDYGFEMAKRLGAVYVPVDHARELVPVSGTAVRGAPLRHWRFVPQSVRPYFVKRVCVYGPESTGKTTLARGLATHFGTVWVAEYARPLLALQGDRCGPEDIPRIARGQMASEDALARQAERVLICDTDVLTTVQWSELLFGACEDWIREAAARRRYDLHLLCDVDTPFVEDPQRFFPERRRELFERFEAALQRDGRPYVVIRGDPVERHAAAVRAIEALLEEPG